MQEMDLLQRVYDLETRENTLAQMHEQRKVELAEHEKEHKRELALAHSALQQERERKRQRNDIVKEVVLCLPHFVVHPFESALERWGAEVETHFQEIS